MSLADDLLGSDPKETVLSAVEKEVRALGTRRGEELITKVIDHKGISDQGDLKGSVQTNVKRQGLRVEMQVGPDAPHVPYVQRGTRPHWAPIKPLKAWAKRKLGDAQLGYAVQHKIAREGTDPQDFLTGPMRMLRREAPRRLESAIMRDLQ